MRHAVSIAWVRGLRLLHERTILVLALMLCVGVGCLLWYMSRVQATLVTSIALQHASLYAQALAEFRTLYTSEVVETVREQGIEVTHDYASKAGAIPLPATLSMLLGQRIGAQKAGAQTRLYSPYPFPWRQEQGGLRDPFSQAAWAALRHHPDQPFYRFALVQGRQSLRYATADRMRPSCVNCHNTHPASPKTNWQPGEVRGILEIILPLDAAVVQARAGLRGTFALMTVMAALGLGGLALVIGRLRRSAAEVTQRSDVLEREITEHHQTEAALRESEEKYRHIINAAADAIISIDEHGLICEFNRAAEQMFGFTKAELLGTPLTPIMPARFHALHRAGLHRYLTTGHRHLPSWQGIELPGCTKAGEEFPLEVAFSLFDTGDKKFLTGVLRNITARKQAEAELQQAKHRAEAANQAKSAFLASMSHELRTPLNGVLGYVQILQRDRALTAAQRESIEAIAQCGQHLLTLINDVLDLSKIESQTLDIDQAPCDLPPLLQGVYDMVSPRAEEKGLRMLVEVAPDVPRGIRTDATKLRQVLVNLLGNAVKFTDHGTVTLRVAESPDTQLVVSVQDTGIGIPPEQLSAIFDPFQQVEAAQARGGTGLGLAISRRLVEALGGALQAESSPGEGSCFTLTLPLVEVDVSDAPPLLEASLTETHALVLAPEHEVTVLIADDHATNRDMLVRLLHSAGFGTLEARDGAEALAILRAHHPPLVLMDMRMPGISGLEATRVIRHEAGLRETVVIAVTASVFPDFQQQIIDIGCDDFIAKPFRATEIFTKIARHLHVRFVEPGATASADAVAEAPPPLPPELARDIACRVRAAIAVGDVTAVMTIAAELTAQSDATVRYGEELHRLANALDFEAVLRLVDALDQTASHGKESP
ncbi:MAG: ATP-binding protein [Candidatus Tectomicrobia bacterium]